jgi:hypothetical protein
MALGLTVTNNASGSLSAGITAVATTLSLKAGEGAEFPAITGSEYFYATIQKSDGNWEIVKVSAVSGDNWTTIVRNQDSSTGAAQAFSADDIVSLRPTAQMIDDIVAMLDAHALITFAPSGTKMYFYQNTAPTGWTIDATVADCLLAIKGGSNDYNVTGGQEVAADGWGLLSHTHTGPSHTHTTPIHKHRWYDYVSTSLHRTWNSGGTAEDWDDLWTDGQSGTGLWMKNDSGKKPKKDLYTATDGNATTGSGGTGATGTPNTGGSGWRFPAAVGIIATKD